LATLIESVGRLQSDVAAIRAIQQADQKMAQSPSPLRRYPMSLVKGRLQLAPAVLSRLNENLTSLGPLGSHLEFFVDESGNLAMRNTSKEVKQET
jgi:hypothetical protein